MKSSHDYGLFGDLILGSLGALLGGWLFRSAGVTAPSDWLGHVLVASVGAMLLVGTVRIAKRVSEAARLAPLGQAGALAADLDAQLRRLGDVERRVLSAVLGRRPSVRDPNRVFDEQLTFGQRVADRVATFGGSWTFIGLFGIVLIGWMIVNNELGRPFDPFPYILLNLVLSCIAALQAPVIMMSQNRQATKDRIDARSDYEVNLRSELEIAALHAKLDAARDRELADLLRLQREQIEMLRRLIEVDGK